MENYQRQYKITRQKMTKILDQENKNQDEQMRPNFEMKRIELDKQLNEGY